MWGRAARTTSPSVRSSIRSTPWVDGCCGPMLRIISSVSKVSSHGVGANPVGSGELLLVIGYVRVGRREVEGPDPDLLAAHGPLPHLPGRLHVPALLQVVVL